MQPNPIQNPELIAELKRPANDLKIGLSICRISKGSFNKIFAKNPEFK